jgi:hypothetical protein
MGILLNTGSYCPVHLGHINLLHDSKEFLEKNFNYKILISYISPSNDNYVGSKA